jgi:hypothetical protein
MGVRCVCVHVCVCIYITVMLNMSAAVYQLNFGTKVYYGTNYLELTGYRWLLSKDRIRFVNEFVASRLFLKKPV